MEGYCLRDVNLFWDNTAEATALARVMDSVMDGGVLTGEALRTPLVVRQFPYWPRRGPGTVSRARCPGHG
ncbi:MAG: hypothetical protein EXR27_21135 [Betaproteobacteria bacterium]|nr:hypothetical protein [Betaproteobacteria bacterium]